MKENSIGDEETTFDGIVSPAKTARISPERRKRECLSFLFSVIDLRGPSVRKLNTLTISGMKNTIEIAPISISLLYINPLCLKRRK